MDSKAKLQCSPVTAGNYKKYKTCFSLAALQRLASSWNTQNKTKTIKINGRSRTQIWNDLNNKLKDKCTGFDKESCWVSNLKADVVPIVAKSLRPSRPSSWDKNPNEWLSNIDIENVMFQYNEIKNNNYHFLGVFAIDFAEKDEFGNCLYEEICSLNIFNLLKKKINYVGLITNLDKHDEPGSHWTSTFICINPYSPSFGAYYYDSVSRAPPTEMVKFMNDLKSKAILIVNDLNAKNSNNANNANNAKQTYPFRLAYNKKQDQYGNNECGMFSIYYQLNWLKYLESNPNAKFEEVISGTISDKMMNEYRSIIFRTKKHIKNNTA
jgi:hypothetical protein